jgi:hypothetical protein
VAHPLQRHGEHVKSLGIFAVGLGGLERPLARLGEVALAPGPHRALQRDIGAVPGPFPDHLVDQFFQLVDSLKAGIHPCTRIQCRLWQGLGHIHLGLKSAGIKAGYR